MEDDKTYGLTDKQQMFCYEYCIDFNATRAAIKAGFSKRTADKQGSQLLGKTRVQNRIKELQDNLAETAGISALMIANEHAKIAFSNMGDLRDGWVTLKRLEDLTPDQKACIQEVSYNTDKRNTPDGVIVEEWVKIKLYDKQKSLDALSKMLGYMKPKKVEVGLKGSIDIREWISSKMRK